MPNQNDKLAGKLVAVDFWPACLNCIHYAECRDSPRHPAFPHRWHWGADRVDFPDGDLILRSWVGTIAIGDDHTGCTDYEVDPAHLLALKLPHVQYLLLERKRQALDRELNECEYKGLYNEYVQVLYDCYDRIVKKQDALTHDLISWTGYYSRAMTEIEQPVTREDVL